MMVTSIVLVKAGSSIAFSKIFQIVCIKEERMKESMWRTWRENKEKEIES